MRHTFTLQLYDRIEPRQLQSLKSFAASMMLAGETMKRFAKAAEEAERKVARAQFNRRLDKRCAPPEDDDEDRMTGLKGAQRPRAHGPPTHVRGDPK